MQVVKKYKYLGKSLQCFYTANETEHDKYFIVNKFWCIFKNPVSSGFWRN